MRILERIGLAALHRIDPERAHGLALMALRSGVAPMPDKARLPLMPTDLAGLKLANPLGLAAGFDKNAEAIAPLLRAGFGFVELGAVTPLPQPGNPRPRLFRLTEDQAVINRFGFNNDGMEAVARRLERRPRQGVIGLNLGANKDSEDRAGDFGKVLQRCGPWLDFATVNVSSPNTEKLRDLQGAEALHQVLSRTQEVNTGLDRPLPLFVKIAPDLDEADLDQIVRVSEETGLAGIIATNTTLARTGLTSAHREQAGGLSGRPLMDPSTRILRQLRARTDLPLVGVGGIASARDARRKLEAGATALQLYSGLVYQGLSLVQDILEGLEIKAETSTEND